MSSPDSSTLFSLARSKLHLSVGKDSCSLHRWVLLKNSIVRSLPLTSSAAVSDRSDVHHVLPLSCDDGEDEDIDDEVGGEEEADSFMFPDAGQLVGPHVAETNASEAEWLNSLLETLGDDDDDDLDSDVRVSVLPADDDEDQLYSPLGSPMSSSDDLPSQPTYYPVPYPPFHPPLIHSYEFDPDFDSPLPRPYVDADPCHDLDDAEDLSIPDAIEDTSDDESDAPTTPSLGRSTSSSSLSLVSTPLLTERSRLAPLVYVDTDDSYFYPFQPDPLPFPDEHHHNSYNAYQEC